MNYPAGVQATTGLKQETLLRDLEEWRGMRRDGTRESRDNTEGGGEERCTKSGGERSFKSCQRRDGEEGGKEGKS